MKECAWALIKGVECAEASCGYTFNPWPLSLAMLDPEFTGEEDSILFCAHCGGKIVAGKRVVVKGKVLVRKDKQKKGIL